LVDLEALGPEVESVTAYFRTSGREMPELYRALANAPRMLTAWTDFAWPLRSEAALPRGLRELAIMRVAQLTGADAEWRAHAPAALHHGIGQPQLDELGAWPGSELFDGSQREVLAFTDELTSGLAVSEETFSALAQRWSPGELVELTLTVAFYSCVSRVLLALEIEAG
jgi:alkylhydroperoxidase family enzyme